MDDDKEIESLEKRMRGETGRTVVQNRIAQMTGQFVEQLQRERAERDREQRARRAAATGEGLAPVEETSQDASDDRPGEDVCGSTLDDLLDRDADPA